MPSTKVFLGLVGKKNAEPVGLTVKMYEFDEAMLERLTLVQGLGEDVKKGERRGRHGKNHSGNHSGKRSASVASRASGPSEDRKKRVSFKKAYSVDSAKREKSEERKFLKKQDFLKKEAAKKEKREAVLEKKRLLKQVRMEKKRDEAMARLSRDFQKMVKREARRQ